MAPGPAQPRISVLVCTYNPRMYLLDWTIRSLEKQTLRADDFEVIVVDNNSSPPLLQNQSLARFRLNLRVVCESRQGLTHARCAAIRASRADLLVFVDDDNCLDADYLEVALRIARQEASVGHFGGIVNAVLGGPVAFWQEEFLPHLGVRDHGSQPITAVAGNWGNWVPIGAGMVCRRRVAEEFVQFVESTAEARGLGHSGSGLMSGEDTLFAHAAYRLGFACSYQPDLRLTHFIRMERLRFRPLARLLLGHGRSYVVVEAVTGTRVDRYSLMGTVVRLMYRLLMHWKNRGCRVGTIRWFWDVGVLLHARRFDQPPKP